MTLKELIKKWQEKRDDSQSDSENIRRSFLQRACDEQEVLFANEILEDLKKLEADAVYQSFMRGETHL